MTRLIPTYGFIQENAYLHIDENSGSGFLIDPGADAERIIQFADSHHWTIEAVLLTHGHFDHIGALSEIVAHWNIPYYIHRAGALYLSNSRYNLSVYTGQEISIPIVSTDNKPSSGNAILLDDGDVIRLKANPEFALRLIHTPGHTEDSSVFYNPGEQCAFVGDTIFKDGIGATHFPGGDTATLYRSIQDKVLTLPADTVLYSGHSAPFTVGERSL